MAAFTARLTATMSHRPGADAWRWWGLNWRSATRRCMGWTNWCIESWGSPGVGVDRQADTLRQRGEGWQDAQHHNTTGRQGTRDRALSKSGGRLPCGIARQTRVEVDQMTYSTTQRRRGGMSWWTDGKKGRTYKMMNCMAVWGGLTWWCSAAAAGRGYHMMNCTGERTYELMHGGGSNVRCAYELMCWWARVYVCSRQLVRRTSKQASSDHSSLTTEVS